MADPEAPISSRKPSKDQSLPALLGQIMSDFLKDNIDDCLPAIVVSYDSVNSPNIVIVQPLIRLLQTDGTELPRGTLEVPIFQYGTAEMSLRFNLIAGSLGWIKANDRDISLFLQSLSEERPNTLRKHSFSDAIFYPDAMKGMAFTADAIMSNADGTVKTEWFNNKIVHTAPTIEMVGNVTVSGTIDSVGAISSDGEVSANAAATVVTLTGHKHSSQGNMVTTATIGSGATVGVISGDTSTGTG